MTPSEWKALEEGSHGAVVKDLRTVIRRGLTKVGAGDVPTLAALFGSEDLPADMGAIRNGLLAFLMQHDPEQFPDAPPSELSDATNFGLTLFRATGMTQSMGLDAARVDASEFLYKRKGDAMTADGVRAPRGPEWYLVKELSEALHDWVEESRASVPFTRSPAVAASFGLEGAEPATYYQITREDLSRGFWWREHTDAYIAAIAALRRVTLFVGADGASDVGPPRHRLLLSSVLKRALSDDREDLLQEVGSARRATARERIVDALAATFSEAQLGSILRELYPNRRGTDSRTLETNLHNLIASEVTRSRSSDGFLAEAVNQLAFTWCLAGREPMVVSTHFDTDIADAETRTKEDHEDLRNISYESRAEGLPDVALEGTVPLWRIHGAPRDESAQSILVGEADLLRDTPVWKHHVDDHQHPAALLSRAMARGDVLFVGTSLTDPSILPVVASANRGVSSRFAILLAPEVKSDAGDLRADAAELAVALNLIARRYQHIGVTPVFVDFEQQVPQLLREIALRVAPPASGYRAYRDRLDDWWDELAPLFGYRKDGAGKRSPNQAFVRLCRQELRQIRKTIEKITSATLSAGAAQEEISLEIWIRNPRARELFRLATEPRGHTQADDQISLDDYSEFRAEVFRSGRTLSTFRLPRTRAKYAVGMPLVLRGAPWFHLPVGVVVVKSTADDGRLRTVGDDADYVRELDRNIDAKLGLLVDPHDPGSADETD